MAQDPRTRPAAPPGEPPEPTHDPTDPGYRDPGDAVPPGVAPKDPPEPTEEDLRVLEKLKRLPERDREGAG